ncbi:MAG: PadR family transcriptional regulator, partial [Roseivirga sp.]|nr:PadR family transcriptional regulator [Roseivirga sp.]
MKGDHLGEFEELTLLTIAVLFDDAYGVAIQKELKSRCNRVVTISTVHAVMYRLKKKGFVDSRYGDITPERGGEGTVIFQG